MRRLLVDTHAVLWWLAERRRLSRAALEAIGDADNEALVSAASLWEISIKRTQGKLSAPEDLPSILLSRGFELRDVRPEDAWQAGALPEHHRDPFDRMIIAQARIEKIPVVTVDQVFDDYDVEVIW